MRSGLSFILQCHVAAQKVLDLGEFPDSGFQGGGAPASARSTEIGRLYKELPTSLEAKDVYFQERKKPFSYSSSCWETDVSSSRGDRPAGKAHVSVKDPALGTGDDSAD